MSERKVKAAAKGSKLPKAPSVKPKATSVEPKAPSVKPKKTIVEKAFSKPISAASKIELLKARSIATRNLVKNSGILARVAMSPDDRYDEDETVRDTKGRWIPGYSANAGGRPKNRVSLTTKLKELLAQADESDEEKDKADALIQMCYEAARSGDFAFFKEIFDRVDGKVTEKVEISESEIKMYGQEAPVDDV